MTIYADGRLLLTVDETCECLHLSRPVIYGLINRGRLQSITIGRARRIPVLAIERYIADQLEAQELPARSATRSTSWEARFETNPSKAANVNVSKTPPSGC
jgi:excisionase family DNA binding protein